ncbi:hypothetical protein [Pseudomonas guariconensis]|uniref:hypothetical protein n=1 Tax=Pseudomonas guariconensis TaxID=1288410 RepID=UPI002D1F8701|nr:hypothetical protein [Pseudomonas guariconensis]MEB3843479.1 hypothetical protein [Pseudomonas guariconensis]MEB3876347.1 hypothetical protein [Pseudomonas guariconensis]MEB3881324.1 hypothetical protein [Pseudomonas guariconensis]MEB3898101.1 hypothetical protein [Pseudomonas guariconensis]
MPTENRSSNTEMVSVPRALAERISNICMFTMYKEDWRALSEILAKPAEQRQGEPVAYAVFTDNGNIRIWSTKVMQEEGKQLVPLYAHSAPPATAEVERLRAQVDTLAEWCGNALNKLADRDALLREALPAVEYESGRGDAAGTSYLQLADKIKSLFVSAEPSAPVEIDERADFERHVILTTGRPIDSELKRHPVRHDEYECRTMQTRWNDWQARAALDRKPA